MATKRLKLPTAFTRRMFRENAGELEVKFGNSKIGLLTPRENQSGSLGWRCDTKTRVKIGECYVWVQISCTMTVCGSSDLPKPEDEQAAAVPPAAPAVPPPPPPPKNPVVPVPNGPVRPAAPKPPNVPPPSVPPRPPVPPPQPQPSPVSNLGPPPRSPWPGLPRKE